MLAADALGGWLVGLLADAGRKKLTNWVLGSEQERALYSAAVRLTAAELHPDGDERAEQLAPVVGEVFKEPVPGELLAEQATVLGGCRRGSPGSWLPWMMPT
jgi:hypothetical protein